MHMEPPAPAADPTASPDRVGAAVDSWKRKLIDLTMRNRALNFRMNKVSTVAVVDEHPAEAFRQLYLRGQALRFKAAPEPEAAPATQAPAPDAPVMEEEDDVSLGLDFAPYDAASLGERHTDQWLQTTAVPEALDRSLRRLEEQARLSIEEQGVNTLFLALGMLHYTESDASDQSYRAPLEEREDARPTLHHVPYVFLLMVAPPI